MKGFKFVTTLVLEFNKIENDDKIYSNSKAETIINENDINDALESICSTILSNIQKSLGKGSSWIIDLVIDQNINISFS